MADDTDLAGDIQKNAQSASEISISGRNRKAQPLPDQIAADQYLANKAAQKSRRFPVRLFKIVPPGASGVDFRG